MNQEMETEMTTENTMIAALVAAFEVQLAAAVDRATAPLVNVIAGLERRIEELENADIGNLVTQRDMEDAIDEAVRGLVSEDDLTTMRSEIDTELNDAIDNIEWVEGVQIALEHITFTARIDK
jgi:hypothetical protein